MKRAAIAAVLAWASAVAATLEAIGFSAVAGSFRSKSGERRI